MNETKNSLADKYGSRLDPKGFLEPILDAVLWSFKNHGASCAIGQFSTSDLVVGSKMTSDQLVSYHMAKSVPEWATHFYWS